jgi:hypothetical protein
MDGQKLFGILFVVILFAYAFLYFGGREYLRSEGFQGSAAGAGSTGAAAGAGSATAGELYPVPPEDERPVPPAFVDPVQQKRTESRVLMESPSSNWSSLTPAKERQQRRRAQEEDKGNEGKPKSRSSLTWVTLDSSSLDPVAKEQIKSLDDYEYNYVFENETDKELSKALRTKLMSQRPMDWAGLPHSSAQFQAGLRESFANATPTVPDQAQPFRNIDGTNAIPPDTTSVEMEERKLLQTYQSPSAQDLLKYDPENQTPEQLIKDIYDVRGLVPTVAHKEGTNVYEIIGVRRKDEKVVYDDEEAPAGAEPVAAAGEMTVAPPQAASDMAASTDPYYDKAGAGAQGSRMDRWNYRAWTPNLERMFAPTEATDKWY